MIFQIYANHLIIKIKYLKKRLAKDIFCWYTNDSSVIKQSGDLQGIDTFVSD